jgi:hypothetical protein
MNQALVAAIPGTGIVCGRETVDRSPLFGIVEAG